jgi:hypothetical protein
MLIIMELVNFDDPQWLQNFSSLSTWTEFSSQKRNGLPRQGARI